MESRTVYLTDQQIELLDSPLSALGLSVRTLNLLENDSCRPDVHGHVYHILTVQDLLKVAPECVQTIPGVGPTTFKAIMLRLSELGFDSRIYSRRPVVAPVTVKVASSEQQETLQMVKVSFKFGRSK